MVFKNFSRALAAISLCGASIAFGAAGAAGAGDTPGATAPGLNAQVLKHIEDTIQKRFPGLEVDEVRPTPFGDLYEVRIGKDVVYANATASYLLQGSLIDTASRRDLTAERVEQLSRVSFGDLPLDIAIKQVKGDGSRKMFVFEDPNCGYCKMLHKTLKDVDDITVYTLLFPILGPDSIVKARSIWCADDKATTWREWMVNGKTPPAAECEAPLEKALALGRELGVQGTPAIFFEDGSRSNGAMPLQALNEKLSSVEAALKQQKRP